MELNLKRRELWFFVLSVFILGGEVGLTANILFTEFYSEYKLYFISILALLIVITIFLATKLILKNSSVVYKNKMIFTYDLNLHKFIDIPYSPSSANARIVSDSLSSKNQEKVKKDHIFDNNPEFGMFINNIVAQIVLSRIIRHVTLQQYSEQFSIEKLKELLVVYRYLETDSIIGAENGSRNTLTLPTGFKIDSTNSNNIKMKSKYGYINFNWNMVVSERTENSDLLSSFNYVDLSNCIEAEIELKFEYGYNIFKIFKKDTEEFNKFIENCKAKMDIFDLEYSKQKYNNAVYPNLMKYIEEQINKKP
ncbi:hypothetical protein ABEV81_06525 [Bacillus paranthracis]|uniref:hypothetical protein n=1 Tax=Bacillus paranthracis TaxID=2026186 RepID=UPI003F6CA6D5